MTEQGWVEVEGQLWRTKGARVEVYVGGKWLGAWQDAVFPAGNIHASDLAMYARVAQALGLAEPKVQLVTDRLPDTEAVAAEQQRCLRIALNEAASVLTGDGWLAAKRIARLIQNGTQEGNK